MVLTRYVFQERGERCRGDGRHPQGQCHSNKKISSVEWSFRCHALSVNVWRAIRLAEPVTAMTIIALILLI